MINIDVPACLEAKELFLQEAVEKYFSRQVLEAILSEQGSVSKRLFDKGKEAGYYIGEFNPKRVPMRVGGSGFIKAYYDNNKRLAVDHEFLGHAEFSFNKGLEFKGPFSYHTNWFNMPWRVRSWDVRIEDGTSHYVSCNPSRVPKALLWLYREMTSDMLDHSFKDMQDLWNSISKGNDRYADVFNFSIKDAVFRGETLSGTVESASNNKTLEYPVTYKNPLTVEELNKDDKTSFEIRFPGNLIASCGCEDSEKGINTKDEPYTVNSWCKHVLALVLDAKYDITKKITMYRPKSERREGGLSELITFYTPLESPWLPKSSSYGDINNCDNPIFKQVNTYLLQEYYINKKTMRQVDFDFFNEFGFEIILDPLLHIKMMLGLNNLEVMKINTAYLTGNVKKGWLRSDGGRLLGGNKRLGRMPVYEVDPVALTSRVETPLPEGFIDVTDDETMRKARISIHPFRHGYTVWLLKNEKDDPVYDPKSHHYDPELNPKSPDYKPDKKPERLRIR